MQITGYDNNNHSRLVALESKPAPTDQEKQQQRLRRASDSYTRHAAAASFIDAEYVDISPSPVLKNIRTQQLTTASTTIETTTAKTLRPRREVLQTKYEPISSPDTPPPGTYINYFA